MTIVLGFNVTPGGRAALRVSLDLAKEYGEKLLVVYGYDPPGHSVGDEFSEHRAALEEMGRSVTAEAVAAAQEAGVEAEAMLVPEHPVEALAGVAERYEGRFIVVGTPGGSPLKSALFGAVEHKLLQRATRPVVVVPGRQA